MNEQKLTRTHTLMKRAGCALILVALISANGVAQETDLGRLSAISLEELMDIKVTSVSRKEQKLSRAAAAVYVITQEDIRRSGMTNIPDLLRMAPGVNVARITANTWAISVRGFNDRYSGNVLALIDGRTVYTQEFSGVFWDQQSVPLEDIDRIEVIRGPGGTVWGANAVNGVINIITKDSKDTQGGLVSAGTGTQDSAQGLVRFGGKAGSKGFYRVFGKYFNVEKSTYGDGRAAADGWRGVQGGFRSDWNLSARDRLMVEGDLYHTGEGQNITTVLSRNMFQTRTFNDRITVDSANLLGRWNHTFNNGSETSLQVSYSDARRFDQATDDQGAADVDFQYRFHVGGRHDLVSGFGYRNTGLTYDGLYNYRYDRPRFTSNLFSAFVQDEVKLTNSISLALGSKFEHNSFTGFEFEPSAQLLWAPSGRRTVWVSAARAIRQPSWFYQNAILDAYTFPLEGGGLGIYQIRGNSSAKAMQLLDFEIGYRTQIHKSLSLDFTGFRSNYHRLATIETGAPFFTIDPPPAHLVIPAVTDNLARARNYGGEVSANWQVTNRWRVSPGISFLQMKILRDASSTDLQVEASQGSSPERQVQVRSTLNLWRNLEWDTSAYYVGALRSTSSSAANDIASYTRLDTRLGWRFGESAELSIVGQNLLSPRNSEFPNAHQVNATQTPRSVFGKLTWRF